MGPQGLSRGCSTPALQMLLGTLSCSSALNPNAFFFCKAAVDGTSPFPAPRHHSSPTFCSAQAISLLCVRWSLTERCHIISLCLILSLVFLSGYWCLSTQYSVCYRMGCLLIQAGYINKLIKKIKWLFKGMKEGSEMGASHALSFPLLSAPCSLLPYFILWDESQR